MRPEEAELEASYLLLGPRAADVPCRSLLASLPGVLRFGPPKGIGLSTLASCVPALPFLPWVVVFFSGMGGFFPCAFLVK